MRVYLDNCCYNRPFDDQSQAKCDWFLTTDNGILKRASAAKNMRIANPTQFILEAANAND